VTAYVAHAEGGTNGNTVGVGDTGSGTPTTVGSIGTGATFTYSSTGGCRRGGAGLCYAYSTGGTAALTYRGWNVNAGASAGAAPFRVYIDPADFTGATVIILRGLDTAGSSQRWRLILTGGAVSLRDSANNAASGATSGVLSSGTRYRVEGYVAGSTPGTYRLLVYVGDSLTATFDSGALTGGSFGGVVQQVRIGIGSSSASQAGKVDDVAVGEPGDALFGPSRTPGAAALAADAALTGAARVRVRGTSGPAGGGTLAGSGRVRTRGTAALAGAAALTGVGRQRVRAAAGLAGTGAGTGGARLRVRCSGALAGAGLLVGAPVESATVQGAADLAAAGSMLGAPGITVRAAASWAALATATLIPHIRGETARRVGVVTDRGTGVATPRRATVPTARG
jgi:hypothetical protein